LPAGKEVHRGAHDYMDAGVRAVQDATAEGEGEGVKRSRDWPGPCVGAMRQPAEL
jgi:hypothetical protein